MTTSTLITHILMHIYSYHSVHFNAHVLFITQYVLLWQSIWEDNRRHVLVSRNQKNIIQCKYLRMRLSLHAILEIIHIIHI